MFLDVESAFVVTWLDKAGNVETALALKGGVQGTGGTTGIGLPGTEDE